MDFLREQIEDVGREVARLREARQAFSAGLGLLKHMNPAMIGAKLSVLE